MASLPMDEYGKTNTLKAKVIVNFCVWQHRLNWTKFVSPPRNCHSSSLSQM